MVLEHIFLLYLIIHWRLLRPNDLVFFCFKTHTGYCGSQDLATKQEVIRKKLRIPNTQWSGLGRNWDWKKYLRKMLN